MSARPVSRRDNPYYFSFFDIESLIAADGPAITIEAVRVAILLKKRASPPSPETASFHPIATPSVRNSRRATRRIAPLRETKTRITLRYELGEGAALEHLELRMRAHVPRITNAEIIIKSR
jgi:hypothetical protein